MTGEDPGESGHRVVRSARRSNVAAILAENEMKNLGDHMIIISSIWVNYHMINPKKYKDEIKKYTPAQAKLLVIPENKRNKYVLD